MSAKTKKSKSGIKQAVIGAAAGCAVVALLCALSSALIAAEKLPEDMMRSLLMAFLFLGAMCAAMTAGRMRTDGKWKSALLSTGVMAVFIIISGVIGGRNELVNRGVLIICASLLCGGSVGAVISAAGGKSKR